MIKRTVLQGALMGFFLFSGAVHLSADEIVNYDFKWRECSKSSQCVVIKDACKKPATVNRDSEKKAQKYYEGIMSLINCEAVSDIDYGNPKAVCIDNECRLIPQKQEEK